MRLIRRKVRRHPTPRVSIVPATPGRVLVKTLTCQMPVEISPQCRLLVGALTGTLARAAAHLTIEDRCAALALCLAGEVAKIEDPTEREAFLSNTWLREMVAANLKGLAKQAGNSGPEKV